MPQVMRVEVLDARTLTGQPEAFRDVADPATRLVENPRGRVAGPDSLFQSGRQDRANGCIGWDADRSFPLGIFRTKVDQPVGQIDPRPFEPKDLLFAHAGVQTEHDEVGQVFGFRIPAGLDQPASFLVRDPTDAMSNPAMFSASHHVGDLVPQFPVGDVDRAL